jgi:NAD-dependent deacetylase
MTPTAIEQAATLIANARVVVALSGAGISVDSGIPDFRSAGGLWERYDPMDYAHIASFRSDPFRVWNMLTDMRNLAKNARPNRGHRALAELESLGKLQAIITQNIDNLHQEAGNSTVIEFHGNSRRLKCLKCGASYSPEDEDRLVSGHPPACFCGAVLKPDIVFFGEPIPHEAFRQSLVYAEQADVMLVVGTSAQVAPANMLPSVTTGHNGSLIEINLERTHLSDIHGAIHLGGSTTEILPKLVDAVRVLL